MRRLTALTLAALVAATVVLLADGAYVDEEVTTAADPDIGELAATVSAGNAIVWFGVNDDFNTAITLTFDNTDVAETAVTQACCPSSLQLYSRVVPDTDGGTVNADFDATDATTNWDTMAAAEISGIATSSPIEDSQGDSQASGTTYTTTDVTTAGAGFLVAMFCTNRDGTFTGTGTVEEQWSPTGGIGLECQIVSRRVAAGGNYNFPFSLDISGVGVSVVYALVESGGAPASVLPALIRPPRGGGGLPRIQTVRR